MAMLVELDEIKALIPKAMVEDIQKDGRYEVIEAEAAKIVRDISGITLPESAAERLDEHDWTLAPMAALMRYLYSPHLAIPNQAHADKIANDYANAIKIIADHRESAQSLTGTIKDLYE